VPVLSDDGFALLKTLKKKWFRNASRNYRETTPKRQKRNHRETTMKPERNCRETIRETMRRNRETIPYREGEMVAPPAPAFHRGTGCAPRTLRSAGPLRIV
jgi:hypothetical protein